MRVFIFGIGGTGSRVLRSLTMLLASGVRIDKKDVSIIPVIIDTDAHNGDTARTRDILKNYYDIRKTFVNQAATPDNQQFFSTPISSFNRLNQDNAENADLDVQFNFQNQDTTFANFINHSGLNQIDKDVIELLYNDSLDDHPELHLNLSVGFKGNPNIGSVVFNELADSPHFKNFESNFTSGDRVFIISSIFGGTGSSGFPTLVKMMRSSTNQNLASTNIGAVTVMPYFNVETDDKSAINSAIFDTKTKAALAYYADDKFIRSINALYYISDNKKPGVLPNVEGGKDQVNNGHVVELISATAIIDFINRSDSNLQTPQAFEFGANHDGNPFTIKDFSLTTKEKYIKHLVHFAYASSIALQYVPTLTNETFYDKKELNIDNSLGVPNGYQKILAFFNEFSNWTSKEMSNSNSGRAFISFNFDSDQHLNNMIHGGELKTGLFNKGLSKSKIAEMLTRNELSEPKDMPIPEKYLNMLYKTAFQCASLKGELP